MPTPRIAEELQRAIVAEAAAGHSDRDIAGRYNLSSTTVLTYRRKAGIAGKKYAPLPESPTVEPIAHEAIRKALKKGPLSTEELANALDCSPKRITDTLAEMKARGAMLGVTFDGRHELMHSVTLPPGEGSAQGDKGDWTHRFGFTTDNHLCNKHSRLDVLQTAYKHFYSVGIRRAYNAGNWIDGEARFNRTELVTAPGMDNQVDYAIDKWPAFEGMETHFIAGDDHEGWYQQREGIEVGRYLETRAEQQGRHDLKYLGYGEADVKLLFGSGSAVMRVVHPGGGSAYAISYTDQKRVESYQGGEKPQIELVGHYHKFNHGFPREVHTIQGGCTCDQTMFMRKKRLQAHVGYSIVQIKQADDGTVTRVSVEWFPFFDRGFYEKRF